MENYSLEYYLDYANGVGVSSEVIDWLKTTFKNYLEKHKVSTTEVEHIIDYLKANEVKKIKMMSYPQAVKKADKWTVKLQKAAEKTTESPDDTKVIHDFKDGFKIVQLIGKNAYEREGNLMSHCVSSYYGRDTKIYSLRDMYNNPHATFESGQQIKGKGNGSIHPKYVKYVVKFLEKMGMEVRDSEMKNLGYINIEKFKKHLSKELKFFKGKYHYKENKLIDKEGKEFSSLDLLYQIPLIDEKTLKINFSLPTFIPLSINFLFKQIKTKIRHLANSGDSAHLASSGYFAQLASSGHSAQLASSGDYAKLANSGDSAQLASSGHYAQLASSGDYAKLASSGHSAQLASSGDYAQLASSGHYAQLASSGHYAKLASSGDSAQLASSGDYAQLANSGDYAQLANSGDSAKLANSGDSAQLASSGHYAQLASSGHYAQLASSGDSAKLASSGDYAKLANSGDYVKLASSGYFAQLESIGKDSVVSAIGYKSIVKAAVGSWITLAEYDKKSKPLCVRSAQIDGKKLKEGIFYKLENGEFTEVK